MRPCRFPPCRISLHCSEISIFLEDDARIYLTFLAKCSVSTSFVYKLMKPTFKTAAVSTLYNQVQPWSHPEYPFLDPEYSPGGYYPVVDFTSIVAGWIATGQTDAISELWGFLTNNGPGEIDLLRRGLAAQVDTRWALDAGSAAELRAIHLLGLRMALQDSSMNKSGTAHTTKELFASRLASTIWKPPTELLETLRDNAAIQADVEDGPHKRKRKMQQAEDGIIELMRDVAPELENVGAWMVNIPPMSRLVVEDFFLRDWSVGSLRPTLYYGERQYGCGVAWNLHFVQWLGCFAEPTDLDDLPSGVTIAALSEALRGVGIDFKKSAKRTELEALARKESGMISALIKRYAPEKVKTKPEWKDALLEWVSRCQKLRCIAGAMLALLSEKSLRRSIRPNLCL